MITPRHVAAAWAFVALCAVVCTRYVFRLSDDLNAKLARLAGGK